MKMFEAPDPEADMQKCAQKRGQIQPSLAGRPRNAADKAVDTPHTAALSI
jgi:hypothetical protein